MKTQTIPLDKITIEDRQRKDPGNLDGLKQSLQTHGLIQPLVVNQNNRLLAGERRYRAAASLGWKEIAVVYRETLTPEECYELELEENKHRKDWDWKEECLLIAKIHLLRTRQAAKDSKTWGQLETGQLFNVNVANVNHAIYLAREIISNPDGEIAHAESAQDAWRVVLRKEQERINADLARRQAQLTTLAATINPLEDLKDSELYTLTETESSNAPQVGSVLAEQLTTLREAYKNNTLIPISKILLHTDAIDHMLRNPSCYDHIITDPPYGIDMDMLNQQNYKGAFGDIETILEEHTVEGNQDLFKRFFPAAYGVLKPNGFLVLWCDQMQWQNLYSLALAEGFKVQRWPLTWVKTHPCLNQAPQANFTKTTEIAMVCRKGTAVLTSPQNDCHILAARDNLCEQLNHPFAKPFEIWKFIIEAVSIEGQTILEPFAGRGSGVLSILGLKRKVVACESNEQHYHALLENVKQLYFSRINPDFVFV